MSLLNNLRRIFSPSNSNGNIIIRRSSAFRISPYVNRYAIAMNNELVCCEGSKYKVKAANSLITGQTSNETFRNDILYRQILSAVRDGYIPFVISSKGKDSVIYAYINNIFNEGGLVYFASLNSDKVYYPFQNISASSITDFFCGLANSLQAQLGNSQILIRNYISVCVNIFFRSENALRSLMTGSINHMRLLQEINNLRQNNFISDNEKNTLQDLANSAQSVSAQVFSLIQDYLFKTMNFNSSQRPVIQIRTASPSISINRISGNKFNAQSSLTEGKSMYLKLSDEIERGMNGLYNIQCFQWYIAKTLKMEFELKPELRNMRVLFVIDNINPVILEWFSWIMNLSGSILLLSYDDFYAKLSGFQDRRQQFISMMETIYFFSLINEESAEWASRFFGTYKAQKIVMTEHPPEEFIDYIFKRKSYAHDEEEKSRFSAHEIQHLYNDGIIFSRTEQIFKPCYRENGRNFRDKNYRARVNFSPFSFA